MTDWTPHLAPGETLRWQGRPDTRLTIGIEGVALGLFALVIFAAGCGLGALVAANGGDRWPFVIGGAALGAAVFALFPVLDLVKRRATRYALTDRRALIRTGRRVESFPPERWHDIRLRPGPPDTVWFARRPNPRAHGTRTTALPFDAGFERIPDGAAVHRMISEMAPDGR